MDVVQAQAELVQECLFEVLIARRENIRCFAGID